MFWGESWPLRGRDATQIEPAAASRARGVAMMPDVALHSWAGHCGRVLGSGAGPEYPTWRQDGGPLPALCVFVWLGG